MESSADAETEMSKVPLLKDSRKGGLITMPFIIANGMLEKVASYGLIPNMTLYLTNLYHMEMIQVSNILLYWYAAINFTPVIGAILADTCVGRFNMMGFGSVFSLLGTFLLWLTTVLPGVRPPPCNESNKDCSSSTFPQLLLLCASFAVIAIGGGGIRSCSLSFGTDQLVNEADHKKGGLVDKFYSWYYSTFMLSVFFGYTGVVYVQDKMGWEIGFGVSVVLMIFATFSFFVGNPFYVKRKTEENLVTELITVIVASCKKRHIMTSSEDVKILYHHKKGSRLFSPTENFRFLNKACIVQEPEQELTLDGTARDPWSLCTVDQVEDLKALLKVIPIWSTGVLAFVNNSQGSFQVLQASSMNRKIIGNFEIPAGSFGTFSLVCMSLTLFLYDRAIIPLLSKFKGKPAHFSTKQRMGAGIFLYLISMIVSAVVEGIRRSQANNSQSMSALWLVPQYCIMGIAEAFLAVAQTEFFIGEFPKVMASIASTLCLVEMSVASVLASFLMNTIDDLTTRGGRESWVSTDLNKGHFDYYFWALSALSLFNFLYYLVCCWTYGPCRDELHKARDEEEEFLV